MELHDTLRICLLAVESRYPDHSIQINMPLFDPLDVCSDCWTVQEFIALLEDRAPPLLLESVHLVIDGQASVIYLAEGADQIPALWLHCYGKRPPRTGDSHFWRKKPAAEHVTSK